MTTGTGNTAMSHRYMKNTQQMTMVQYSSLWEDICQEKHYPLHVVGVFLFNHFAVSCLAVTTFSWRWRFKCLHIASTDWQDPVWQGHGHDREWEERGRHLTDWRVSSWWQRLLHQTHGLLGCDWWHANCQRRGMEQFPTLFAVCQTARSSCLSILSSVVISCKIQIPSTTAFKDISLHFFCSRSSLLCTSFHYYWVNFLSIIFNQSLFPHRFSAQFSPSSSSRHRKKL